MLTEIKDGPSKDVVVGGDARCDSPGYSAKYGTYTIMDLERNKILDIQLVQVKHSDGILPKLCTLTIIYFEGNNFLKCTLYHILYVVWLLLFAE